MFSEWRKRSKLWEAWMKDAYSYHWLYKWQAYDLARAAFKAGVRAGIKQEQARAAQHMRPKK